MTSQGKTDNDNIRANCLSVFGQSEFESRSYFFLFEWGEKSEAAIDVGVEIIVSFEWNYFLALFENLFSYLPGSRMHQDWVYLSSEQGVSNELYCDYSLFWTKLEFFLTNLLRNLAFLNLKAMGYLQKQSKEQKSCWDPGGSGSLVDLTEVFTFWRNPFLIG